MLRPRFFIHALFLYCAPLLALCLGLSWLSASLLVLLMLLWRWGLTLADVMSPPKVPELQLDSISASHFVEKVRWSLDRLGVEYVERPMAGVIGVVFLGRTVPRLRVRSGIVESSIGNSPEILRYLWGRYGIEREAQAAFLKPTAERVAWERRIDRVGADLQVWVYFHILPHRDLTEHAWGCNSVLIPAYQRRALHLMFPFLRAFIRKAFRISDRRHAKAVEHVDQLLADAEAQLAQGHTSLLGGEELDFVDISFAAISGLWLQPKGYGAGRADQVRFDYDRAPPKMQQEITHWRETYPLATAFVERLYAEHRRPANAS